MVLMGVQMACMLFNHVVKPLKYKSVRAHNIELMNDYAVIMTLYFMLLFTDLIREAKIKYEIAWYLISIQGTAFIASISLALVDIGRTLKQKYKTRKYCVKKTEPDFTAAPNPLAEKPGKKPASPTLIKVQKPEVQEEEEKKAEFNNEEGDVKVESFLWNEDANFE
jgi:hypothetical protein